MCNEKWCYALEIDSRLLALTTKEKEIKVSEEEFKIALKGYKLDEFLIFLAEISVKLFDSNFREDAVWKKEKNGFIIHKPSKQFVTDFAIEYITNILLLSGSNNFKRESIKYKDNIIAVFSIYHNSIMHPININGGAPSFLVPMFYQQITSQQDIKDAFVRQWLIFEKAHNLVEINEQLDLNAILLGESGMTIIEYIKLSFLILAAILTRPRFNFGSFDGSTISGMDDVLNNKKISAIIKQLAVTQQSFIDLDKKYNSKLKPEHTKSRYNPLWEKPIIILASNDFVVPSLSAYLKGALRGLYWIFENAKGKTFRDYFGKLFENYCGIVIKDIFGDKNVRPGINYGKENKQLFDWVVDTINETILFEAKGYQFPLNALQTGNPELIRKAVFQNLVGTVQQMYERLQDVSKYDELKDFRNKNIAIVAVFYDIPLVSTNLYDSDIKLALNGLDKQYPGIKDFKYYFLAIDELENFAYVKDCITITELIDRVKNTPGAGVTGEIDKIIIKNNFSLDKKKNLLDKKFTEFYTEQLGLQCNKNI